MSRSYQACSVCGVRVIHEGGTPWPAHLRSREHRAAMLRICRPLPDARRVAWSGEIVGCVAVVR